MSFRKLFATTLWLLALLELRSEIILLYQHFTWTSFFYAILNHKLAFLVLIIIPYWFFHAQVTLKSSDP